MDNVKTNIANVDARNEKDNKKALVLILAVFIPLAMYGLLRLISHEYADQFRAIFHYSFKHMFEVEFGIRVVIGVFVALWIIYLWLWFCLWFSRKIIKKTDGGISFISRMLIIPIRVRISEKLALTFGDPRWQEHAEGIKRRFRDREVRMKDEKRRQELLKVNKPTSEQQIELKLLIENAKNQKKPSKKVEGWKFWVPAYFILIAVILPFRYLTPDWEENLAVLFLPERVVLTTESFIVNTLFHTDGNEVECFLTFLHEDDESVAQTPVQQIELPSNSARIVPVFEEEQTDLRISFEVNAYSTHVFFNEERLLFNKGQSYEFRFDDENVRLLRILDYVYLFCECGIRMLPFNENHSFVLRHENWSVPEATVFIQHDEDEFFGLPTLVMPLIYDSTPQIYVDGWHSVLSNGNTVLSDSAGRILLTVQMSGRRLQWNTNTERESFVPTSSVPTLTTVLFVYDEGRIIEQRLNVEIEEEIYEY